MSCINSFSFEPVETSANFAKGSYALVRNVILPYTEKYYKPTV